MKNKFDISDFVDYLTEEKVIKNFSKWFSI